MASGQQYGGVGDITLNGRDIGLFKSPSLRNVEFTGPYMHDGRLATLEDVIEHYSRNVRPHPNHDGRVRRAFLGVATAPAPPSSAAPTTRQSR